MNRIFLNITAFLMIQMVHGQCLLEKYNERTAVDSSILHLASDPIKGFLSSTYYFDFLEFKIVDGVQNPIVVNRCYAFKKKEKWYLVKNKRRRRLKSGDLNSLNERIKLIEQGNYIYVCDNGFYGHSSTLVYIRINGVDIFSLMKDTSSSEFQSGTLSGYRQLYNYLVNE